MPLLMRDGRRATAQVIANIVTWACACGRLGYPLLALSSPTEPATVCPSCQRRYRFFEERDRVEEIP